MRYAPLLLVVWAGCSLFGPEATGVQAYRAGDRVEIVNRTSSAIYYFAAGAKAAALVDWMPTLAGENRLAPGERRRVSPLLNGSEDQVFVFWWTAVEAPCSAVPVEGDAACQQPGEVSVIEVRW